MSHQPDLATLFCLPVMGISGPPCDLEQPGVGSLTLAEMGAREGANLTSSSSWWEPQGCCGVLPKPEALSDA